MTDHAAQSNRTADIVWPAALAAGAVCGSLALACMMPFVAIAVVAAATMSTYRAGAVVLTVWIINQTIGYALLDYPHDAATIAWGFAMGGSSLIAMTVAKMLAGRPDSMIATRLIAAFAAAFVTYELVLFGFAHIAGGLETFSPAIVRQIATNDAMWFAGLVALRIVLTRIAPRLFGKAPVVRLA